MRLSLKVPAIGAVLAVLLLTGVAATSVSAEAPEAKDLKPRKLIIALDAVPFWVVEDVMDPDLGEEALFKDFKGPVPMVSTFPSSTSVALVGMLGPFGLGLSPGYEARFYDWQMGKVRGGGVVSYRRIEFPWREYFDWGRKGPIGSAIEGTRPIKYSIKRLRRAIQDFATNNRETFFIYIAPTDTAAHTKGPEALKKVLVALDQMLTELEESQKRPIEVVIFSDHGLAGDEPLINVWKGLKKAIKEAGFKLRTKRLKGPKDVVMVPFGLVSSAEAYVMEENKGEIAEVLASAPGVDVCVYSSDAGWLVESKRGRAAFRAEETSSGRVWFYDSINGDPFDYLPLIEKYRAQAGSEPTGMRDQAWFQASWDATYPDAFYRLTRAFELVENPASILCSVEPGYMYGSRKTERLAMLGGGRLRWTHGALFREATWGFLTSNVTSWEPPAAVRFDESLLPFLEVGRGADSFAAGNK
ncbi:MAG: hypothetical protein EP299_13190 [Acidobacteria bacterium]|nr:MAG: hypothetical protein EP299_13190 [Acidobacteriota bacterium]